MTDHISPPKNLPPGSLVWVYLRDSGGYAQELSVPQQKAELLEYCKHYDLVIAHIFADVAKSAGSVAGREAFLDMIEMSLDVALRPKGLLLWNFARFARAMEDSRFYKSNLRHYGMVIHSLTDPIPEGTFGPMVEQLVDYSNEEKRIQTSRDVKRALRSLFQQGYSFGVPPRGYLRETVVLGKKRDGSERKASRWVPDLEIWDMVKLAWQMRADGCAYEKIQKATGRILYRSKTCWPTFFHNKAYLGIGVWGELEIPDHHPAAIDQATWDAVQKRSEWHIRQRKPGNLHHPRRLCCPSLLSGIAVCAYCGSALSYDITNRHSPTPWPFYICGKKTRQGWKSCQGRMINAHLADEAVFEALMSQVLTGDFLSELLVETRKQITDTAPLDREIARVKKALVTNERAIRNLLDLAEAYGATSAVERLREREDDKARLKLALNEAETKRENAQVELAPQALRIALDTWQARLAGAQDKGDLLTVKNFLARFFSKIEVGYHTVRVVYTYPAEPNDGR